MNRLFLPQEALDRWLVGRTADLSGAELRLHPSGQRFRLVEALRVLTEVSGAEDPIDVCGRVKTVEHLLELGAELLGDSMIISENAYQVVPGWLATPLARSLAPGAEAEDVDGQLSAFLTRHG